MKTIHFILLALTTPYALAGNPTPDFYKCTGKVSGEWNFGRAPYACNASAFGSDSVIRDTYSALVFVDARDRNPERKRYMDDLHTVIRDAAEYYIKKRKPSVSNEEVEAFKLGLLTTAAQESYWTHYRFASDNKYKMMRGDVGHGHGLMQIDDRAHYPVINQGLAWNLMGNVTYAMDIFYTQWEAAPKKSCVSSPTNWTARTRSAWAAYNGGPGSICRWTNSGSAWARNDQGFYNNLKNKTWRQYVTNFTKKAPINVPCLIEKRENCAAPGEPTTPTLRENVLYRTAAGVPCVLKANTVKCMAEYRDYVCLRAVSSFTNAEAEAVTEESLSPFPRQTLDRHTTCAEFEPSLLKVGSMAEAVTTINLRATPGGGLLGSMPEGEVADILDFEIRNVATKDRYYKVKVDNVTGFVYAGDTTDFASWIKAAPTSGIPSVIARPGEKVKIVNSAGINLRTKIGGTVLVTVPALTQLTVLEYVIQGASNDVYYKVTHQNKTGYIYSGMLLPKDTTGSWTKRIK